MGETNHNPIAKEYECVVQEALRNYLGSPIDETIIGDVSRTIMDHTIEFVGVTEASKVIGVTQQRVDQLAREDKLPPTAGTIGKRRFWLLKDIVHFSTERMEHVRKFSNKRLK